MQLCQPYLLRAIELCQPKFILCFGGHPAQRLSGKNAADGSAANGSS